jgi:hypothetical protein
VLVDNRTDTEIRDREKEWRGWTRSWIVLILSDPTSKLSLQHFSAGREADGPHPARLAGHRRRRIECPNA